MVHKSIVMIHTPLEMCVLQLVSECKNLAMVTLSSVALSVVAARNVCCMALQTCWYSNTSTHK
jgi:hypothetical protein